MLICLWVNRLVSCIQDPAACLRPQLHRVIKRTFSGNDELLHYRNIILRGFHKVLFQGTEGNIRENRFPLSHDETIITLLLKKRDPNDITNLHKVHFSALHKISNLAWAFSKAYESYNLLCISLCHITFPLLIFFFNRRVSATLYICFDIYLIISDQEKWLIALVIQYFPELVFKGKDTLNWNTFNINVWDENIHKNCKCHVCQKCKTKLYLPLYFSEFSCHHIEN